MNDQAFPNDPPPPPGFMPIDQSGALPNDPPPPAGFLPLDQAQANTQGQTQDQKQQPSVWWDPGRKEHPWLTAPIDLAQGALSGVASTLHGIDELGTKGWSYLSGQPQQENIIPKEWTVPPPSLAGKVGHGAEQVAEFLLPAGEIGAAGKAIEAAKVAPWLKFGSKAAIEAIPAYGITMAQTGGDTTAARNAALMAGGVTAALPAVGKVLAHWTGASTGAGETAVTRAATDASPDLMAAMRGEISEIEILDATRQAVSNVAQKRSADYINELGKIDPRIRVDLAPARRATNDLLNKFRVRKIFIGHGSRRHGDL